mgnify:CR=1 FL=1
MARGLTEELVLRHYRLQGYFVESDHQFKLRKGSDRKVGGWSDIDILAYNDKELVVCQCKSQLVNGSARAITADLKKWFSAAIKYLHGEKCPYSNIAEARPIRKEVVTFLFYAGGPDRRLRIENGLARDDIALVDADEVIRDIFRLSRTKLAELSKETPNAYGKELDPMLDLMKYLVYRRWLKEGLLD